MLEDEAYECPECGVSITSDMSSCPGCGIELEWDGEEEALDEVIEAAEQHQEEETAPEPEEEGLPDIVEEPPEAVEAPEPDPVPYEEPPRAPSPDEAPPFEAPPVVGPKLYGRLSIIGIVFSILAVVAVILTLVAANYDVWVQGAEEENIGPTQQNAIYLGVAGIVVCLMVVVLDWWRNRS